MNNSSNSTLQNSQVSGFTSIEKISAQSNNTGILPTSIGELTIIVNLLNWIIFIMGSLAILSMIGGLIVGIIMTLAKNKSAKIAWIIAAVGAVALFLCIILFTIISISANLDPYLIY